jgi:antitoxin component of RelBE/YafQ-DinJ toxin-antitoxin module
MALLTFRLDQELRQRLRARLAADGRTMSEVITKGLHQYVQQAPPVPPGPAEPEPEPETARLPEAAAARLRELRVSGRSGVLSATLTALYEDGWPLPALAEALGISRQAVQARIRQRVPAELRDRTVDCAPPPVPRRRSPRKGSFRPHLTIKIDHALRAAAHRAAARNGHSLSQVVESILAGYLAGEAIPRTPWLHHGMPE